MIVYYPPEADLFQSEASVLVNPVNAAGAMGAGMAKQFAARFPEIVGPYRLACRTRKLVAGSCILLPSRNRLIACVATKDHWRFPSRLEYVEQGMDDLVEKISGLTRVPARVAVPALGCGLGGLDWEQVRPVIVRACERRKEIVWELYAARNGT